MLRFTCGVNKKKYKFKISEHITILTLFRISGKKVPQPVNPL